MEFQRKRFEKLLTSQNATERTLTEQPAFKTILRRINLPCRNGKETVCSTTEAKEEWTRVIIASADGREMTTSDIHPASYLWVGWPSKVFPRLHLSGIQLRGGTLTTKARATRGRKKSPHNLECGGAYHSRETLNHILQVCEITHDARCVRQNWIIKQLEKTLRKKVDQTLIEPIISTKKSFIKPDLIINTGKQTIIIDVSVVANPQMEQSHRLKMEKYGSRKTQRPLGPGLRTMHL